MITEIKNLRFSQPYWYTCLSLTAACHTDVPVCVCMCVRETAVAKTMRKKIKIFCGCSDLEVSITVRDYEGLPTQQSVCVLRLVYGVSSGCVCCGSPVCWRLCLVRACLVPPAKPHRSHR